MPQTTKNCIIGMQVAISNTAMGKCGEEETQLESSAEQNLHLQAEVIASMDQV